MVPRYLSDSARRSANRYPFSPELASNLDTLIHEYINVIDEDLLQAIKDAEDVGDVTDLLDVFFDQSDV
jgi:hypothetical protein